MKRLMFAIVCLFMLGVATACQDGDAPIANDESVNDLLIDDELVDDPAGNEELETTLSIALGGGYSNPAVPAKSGPVYKKIHTFEEEHQEISIEVKELMYMMGTSFPIDPFPDIIELAPHQVRWVADGELESLDSVVQMVGWSGAYADLIARMTVNGDVRMLPLKAEPMVVYYDEQVFQLLNLTFPHDDWTWDDFVNVSKQLDAYGYNISIPDSFEAYEPIIKGLGGSYISPDGSAFTGFLDSEATASAFEQVIASIHAQRANSESRERPVVLGIDWPSNLYGQLIDNADLKLARMPIFPDGNRYNTMFTTGLSMSTKSKLKTTALDLIKSIIGEDEREAIRSLNYNALTSREGRYQVAPPVQMDQLLAIMEQETAIATPNPFQLHTNITFYYGLLYNHEDVFLKSFPQMFEQGTATPILSQLAGIIDTLYSSMRGNWRGL